MTPAGAAQPFSPEQARARVDEQVAAIPPLAESDIARVPDLDAAGLYAFSVMPHSTREAGEVLYLVGPDEMLTGGDEAGFDSLMARLGVGRAPGALDLDTFARLFLRLRALRRGVVLDRPDGHGLLEARPVPAEQFSRPRADFDERGARYRFWMFDTDRLEPEFWDVRVAPDGTTAAASGELV